MYFIVGKTVDEKNRIISYLITNGKSIKKVTPQQVYIEYQKGNISYLKGFNIKTGEVDFKNINNTLLPTFYYNEYGLNNSVSVLQVLKENGKQIGARILAPSGEIMKVSLSHLIKLINSDKIQLFNAKIVNNKIVMKTVIDKEDNADNCFKIENGVLIEYTGNSASVTIPSGVVKIGKNVFRSDRLLRSIIIPDFVKEIDDYAFFNCGDLESVVMPEDIKLGRSCFDACNKLYNKDGFLIINNKLLDYFGDSEKSKIVIPKGVKYICGAFRNYDVRDYRIGKQRGAIKKVIIPEGVIGIYDESFADCYNLEIVIFPSTLQFINTEAFAGTKLNSVIIPSKIKKIGRYALGYCDFNEGEYTDDEEKMYDFVINGVAGSASEKYAKAEGFKFQRIGEDITIESDIYGNEFEIKDKVLIRCLMLDNRVIIPDGVTGIGDKVFKETRLTSVTIPNSVTSIGNYVFDGCTGLTNIDIPDKVTSIGNYAFNECTGLTNIAIPEIVTSIGNYAFNGCTGFTNLIIPEHIKIIGVHTFAGCTGLTSIKIPDKVTIIHIGAFEKCTGLTDITIPDKVTSIKDSAFYGCTGLKSITIPDSVTSIEESAFCGCTSLTSIKIPDGVKKIDKGMFFGCTGLKNIVIGDDVKSIGMYAFRNCTSLTSISIPDSTESIGDYAFGGCTGLKDITIGNGVKSIGKYAFECCEGLTSIKLSDNLQSIDNYAFMKCIGLSSLTIPDSVISIGMNAFEDCTGLTSINISDSIKKIGSGAFARCIGLTSINIPDGLKKKWRRYVR